MYDPEALETKATGKNGAAVQRLRARMARRPGRWRRNMARSRYCPSPSTGWEARSESDRSTAERELEAA